MNIKTENKTPSQNSWFDMNTSEQIPGLQAPIINVKFQVPTAMSAH